MKLNNRGWGLRTMMIFVLILMICLVVVAALINNNFGQLVGSTFYDYEKLENKVNSATEKYMRQNNINISDTYIVTVKKLQSEGLLDNISDNSTKCTGYSTVEKKSDKLTYNAYIKCGSTYKTKNYSSNLDK